MKYEAPELTALTPAINAVQGLKQSYSTPHDGAASGFNDANLAYEDWE